MIDSSWDTMSLGHIGDARRAVEYTRLKCGQETWVLSIDLYVISPLRVIEIMRTVDIIPEEL